MLQEDTIEPERLQLFKTYNEPRILVPQFRALFSRLGFLTQVTDNSDINTLQRAANDLIELVKEHEKGEYYARKLLPLISYPQSQDTFVFRYDRRQSQAEKEAGLKATLHIQEYRDNNYRQQLKDASSEVFRLIIEMLGYQNWPMTSMTDYSDAAILAKNLPETLLNQLPEAHRIWLKAIYEKQATGQEINERVLKVELRKHLPVGFEPKQIDLKLLRHGTELTPFGLWLIAPDSDSSKQVDTVIQSVKSILSENPLLKSVHAGQVQKDTGIPERVVGKVFEQLADTGVFHEHGFSAGGGNGWITFTVCDRAFDAFTRYEGMDKLVATILKPANRNLKPATHSDNYHIGQYINNSGGTMSTFDQRGQQVQNQNNAAGNLNISGGINLGDMLNQPDFIQGLQKVKAELAQASQEGAIDADVAIDADFELASAIQQMKKPEPNRGIVVGHLDNAKQLLVGIGAGTSMIAGIDKLIETVSNLLNS